MISGAAQADVAVLMVPADGNFISSIASGKTNGEVKGQTREHARLLNLLGVKQLIVCVNKMDSDLGQYKKERYEEIINEVKSILVKVGWKKPFIDNRVPFIPISGFKGDNLIDKSTNMPWWTGVDVKISPKEKIHVHTMLDALNDMVQMKPKDSSGPLRIPVSGVYKIKGVGDIITGRVESGTLKPGAEVKFIPTDTTSSDCRGKAFSIEMHHKSVPEAVVGDNIGINVKNLNKANMPKVGDVIVMKDDNSLKQAKSFVAQCQVLDHPGQLKCGYTPIAIAATGKAPIRITKINWKQSKKTGNVKVDNPEFIETNDLCELTFTPQGPFVV
jgi:elongation factor 1-alpha